MVLHIEHLEECLYLAQTLSFTQTARHFGIAQPALSKHISNLEKYLGIQIFVRDTHHVRLTKEGHTIIENIADVSGAFSTLRAHAYSICRDGGKTMTIAYLRGAVGKAIPLINERFLQRYPDTDINYHVSSWPGIFDDFIAGGADLAICGVTSNPLDRKFDRLLLHVDRFCAVVPPNHPLANRETLTAKDLAGCNVYIPARTFLPNEADSISAYLQANSDEINIYMNVMDFESVPMILRLHSAVNISATNIQDYYNDPELKYIPLDDCPLSFPICIYWRTNELNPRQQAFIDITKRAFLEPE